MKNNKVINVSFDNNTEDLYEKIQFITNSPSINRSGFLRNLISIGLKEYETRNSQAKSPVPLC
jgi:metal-responsive CopG/Arc/MetJ family transcriptional regulator